MSLWTHSSAHFPEVLCCIFILWWSSRFFDLLPDQPILCLGASPCSLCHSPTSTLPAPLPFSQLLLSYLLVRVLMSNQVQLFFPFVVISVSCSYSSLSLWLLAVCCHFQQILCPTFYFFFNSHPLNYHPLFFSIKL